MRTYTVGDTAPDLVLELASDDSPSDLTGVLSVLVKIKKPSGALVEHAAVIDSVPTSGLVSLTPLVTDFDEDGLYYVDVRVTRANGRVQHSTRPVTIRVRAEYEASSP